MDPVARRECVRTGETRRFGTLIRKARASIPRWIDPERPLKKLSHLCNHSGRPTAADLDAFAHRSFKVRRNFELGAETGTGPKLLSDVEAAPDLPSPAIRAKPDETV